MPTIYKPYFLFDPLAVAVERAIEDFTYMNWNRRPVCIQVPPQLQSEVSGLVSDIPVEACVGIPLTEFRLVESR
jgi:hypothetical protein